MNLAILAVSVGAPANQPFNISEHLGWYPVDYWAFSIFLCLVVILILVVPVYLFADWAQKGRKALSILFKFFLASTVIMGIVTGATSLYVANKDSNHPETAHAFVSWARDNYGVDFSNNSDREILRALRSTYKPERIQKEGGNLLANSGDYYSLKMIDDSVNVAPPHPIHVGRLE